MQTIDAIVDKEKLFEGFEYLMPFRVENILLVSSQYDSFTLREDGRLNELLIGESIELDLQHVPGITHVRRGAEALDLLRSQPQFNLVVANLELEDMDAAQLAAAIRKAGLDVPVVVLAYDYREIKRFVAQYPASGIERIFHWQGNARILIAILKYIEDKRNVHHDTAIMGVPVVLVVEDSIRYYSSFLPVIYTELITQSRRLLREGINIAHKLLRMRARPKILLCSEYEDAAEQALRYKEYLFGVISDVEFPRKGKLTPEAGFALARMIREEVPDVPIVLQSSRTQFLDRAEDEGFSFLRKRSPTLLSDLRELLTRQFALGDFVFRLPDKTEVARASDLNALEAAVQQVPVESVIYHSERNHFSHWLRARTEFALAQKLRPRKVSDFATHEDLRRDLIESIAEYRREQSQVLIGDFSAATFKATEDFFLRIGSGSLGGKARGLAFVRHLLLQNSLADLYPGIRIAVPPTLALTTDVFEQFLSDNGLLDFALRSSDESEIQQRFLAAPLPLWVREALCSFLQEVHYPLAVRSSSLLEDSQQPFTGVYETFMVGNRSPDLRLRLGQLMEAIKRVYASTFSQAAKAYVRATPYRLEEEKMAVVVQRVVGASHGPRFYPDFSGVVRSRNFYPVSPMEVNDGIAAVALGLGRTVVEGGKCLMFCPRYPRHPVQFSSVEDILANSQTEFWALELDHPARGTDPEEDLREVRFGLETAEKDGTLRVLASTYSADAHAVYDGLNRPGARIVSFASILKHEVFPLSSILTHLTRIVEEGLGRPVEIEFAARLAATPEDTAEFGFLQMRPLALTRGGNDLHFENVDSAQLLCHSSKVLGNGRIEDLHDLVVVDLHRFERAQSREVAREVAQLNAKLSEDGIPYLLVGVGRWGSTDPWLGIPVAWEDVSGARVIVEAGFRDFRVTPSQGSHFFQNLAAFRVGYFTINPDVADGFMDWDWLGSQTAIRELGCVRHMRFEQPLVVVMNGSASQGVIFKPAPSGKT